MLWRQLDKVCSSYILIPRFYEVSHQLLFENHSHIPDYVQCKSRDVSNRTLAQRGMEKNLHLVIRSRNLSLYWGDASNLSYNIVADVVEAVFGSVAFYNRSDIDLILVSNKIFSDTPSITQKLIEFYRHGSLPLSIAEYLESETIDLNDPIIQKKIEKVESIQRCFNNELLMCSYSYRNKSILCMILTNGHSPASTFVSEV